MTETANAVLRPEVPSWGTVAAQPPATPECPHCRVPLDLGTSNGEPTWCCLECGYMRPASSTTTATSASPEPRPAVASDHGSRREAVRLRLEAEAWGRLSSKALDELAAAHGCCTKTIIRDIKKLRTERSEARGHG